MKLYLPLLMLVLAAMARGAVDPAPVSLWPGKAPGEVASLPPEADLNTPKDPLIAGRRIIRLGNISTPTLTVYRAPADNNTGAAVVVFPGGGYHILAYDLEGTEVCAWLNSIGVNAILLKYRVPAREGRPRYAPAFQDAQRALGWVRHEAKSLGIDPQRVGVLGFSAGGHLAAVLSTNQGLRTYDRIDAADDESCRPDFTILIYPGGLVGKDHPDSLPAEVKPSAATPPTFIAMAEDDPVNVDNALVYYRALKDVKVPVEMHLYPTGGHGYGLRRTADRVTTWPDRVADWLKAGNWLAPKT